MQCRESLELKTVGRLGESTGDVPCVLVLSLAFPRDPLGTQNIGPGEPLVRPGVAAVIMPLSVICLFPRHTVCSVTIPMIGFRNSKLPMWGFFQM